MKTFKDAFGLNPSHDGKTRSSTDRVKKHRATKKRTEISWDMQSHDHVKKLAEKHGLKFSPFVIQCVIGYLNLMFILPDPDVLYQLQLELKRQGTNLNQIAYNCNRTKNVSEHAIKEALEHVKRIEEIVTKALTYPDDLESLVKQALKERPSFAVVLQHLLDNHSYNDY